MEFFNEGSIHGRFQPFHNGHLEYVLSAKKRCDYLWVGITQFDIKNLIDCPEDQHRSLKENNPLTYFERVQLINKILLHSGLTNSEFCLIPFPIDNPNKLNNFLSPRIPIFTTIYDEWNIHKIHTLENEGYKVIVLYKREIKTIDGMLIRKLIRNGNNSWKKMVPEVTVNYFLENNIASRLVDFK